MNRTIVVQLKPTPEQVGILQRTLQEPTACFSFETDCRNGVELHKETYYPLRAQHPDLPAQLVCAARVKATEAVKSALTWRVKHAARYPALVAKAEKQGRKIPAFKPVRCPESVCAPICYDQRSYRVQWNTLTCHLASVAGRQEIGFTVPKHARQYLGWTVCSADLCFRHKRFFLHIVVSQPAPVVVPSHEVIGVDLGINHPAVTSKRAFLGDPHWKEQERRLFRLRRKLQAKGTKSAKRHLRHLGGQLFRQRKDHDHVLSKRLVQHASPRSTLVLENLSNIRTTSNIGRGKKNKNVDNKRTLHSWSFAQLWSFISYKAEARGIQMVQVDPRHTSQRCSRCGHIARNNRRSQNLFLCRACGYCIHADFNASYNVRDKHLACLASLGTSLAGGSLVKRPLVSNLRIEGQAPRL